MRDAVSIPVLLVWEQKRERRAKREDGDGLEGRGAESIEGRRWQDELVMACSVGLVLLLACLSSSGVFVLIAAR